MVSVLGEGGGLMAEADFLIINGLYRPLYK